MIHVLLFVVAISLDSFFVALAYGNKVIRIPWACSIVIALIETFILALAILFANVIQGCIPVSIGNWLGCILFLLIGCLTIGKQVIKNLLQKYRDQTVKIAYRGVMLAIDVYVDETKADLDGSKYLSMKESIVLALTLSLDACVSGIAFGLYHVSMASVISLQFIISFLMLTIGFAIGLKMNMKHHDSLSWISGCIFIILGLSRLK